MSTRATASDASARWMAPLLGASVVATAVLASTVEVRGSEDRRPERLVLQAARAVPAVDCSSDNLAITRNRLARMLRTARTDAPTGEYRAFVHDQIATARSTLRRCGDTQRIDPCWEVRDRVAWLSRRIEQGGPLAAEFLLDAKRDLASCEAGR